MSTEAKTLLWLVIGLLVFVEASSHGGLIHWLFG